MEKHPKLCLHLGYTVTYHDKHAVMMMIMTSNERHDEHHDVSMSVMNYIMTPHDRHEPYHDAIVGVLNHVMTPLEAS